MQQRNVSKNQILAQDIALGVGRTKQTRRGVEIEGDRVDIPVPVYSHEEIAQFSPQVANRLILQIAVDKYVYYVYNESATDGIKSIEGVGYWVPQNVRSDITLATLSDATVMLSSEHENNFITLTNPSGCVVKMKAPEVVPCLVFLRSDTDGVVHVLGDTGVTVHTASTNRLFARQSAVGLIALSATSWLLVGDLQVA